MWRWCCCTITLWLHLFGDTASVILTAEGIVGRKWLELDVDDVVSIPTAQYLVRRLHEGKRDAQGFYNNIARMEGDFARLSHQIMNMGMDECDDDDNYF